MVETDQLRACLACDAVWRIPPQEEGDRHICKRCGAVIDERKDASLNAALAANTGAAILTLAAVSFPFLSVSRSGLENKISVIDAVSILWLADMAFLSVACGLLILLIPVLRALLLMVVLVGAQIKGDAGRPLAAIYRLSRDLEPWAMAEIFLVGVIVSLVKVGSLAQISVGPSFWALCGLVGTLSFVQATQSSHTIWAGLRGRL
ncbi:MAG: paraquat-inducible protein A [Pseudomonadota bacterium]